MTIVVFGSANIDLVAKVRRFPNPGETLSGETFFTAAGGKGANQAVAAARLGVSTHLVGRVGSDVFGSQLLAGLQAAGVNCDRLLADDTTHSGVASIVVDDSGENNIITIAGANGQIDASDVERLEEVLPNATALLLQLEIPLPAVFSAAQTAKKAGVPAILDPAPAPETFPAELYPLIDIITPNEVEAAQLTGLPVYSPETAAEAARILRQRGVKNAIVKLGDRGVVCATPNETFTVPAFSVRAIDTVAAGDAFNGGLAAALDIGKNLQRAIIWGAAAGAISVTKTGAQPSLPNREIFEDFLKQQGVIF